MDHVFDWRLVHRFEDERVYLFAECVKAQ